MALAVFLGGEAAGRFIVVPDPPPPIFMIPVTNRSTVDDNGPGSHPTETDLTHTARRQTYVRDLDGPDIGCTYRFKKEESYGP